METKAPSKQLNEFLEKYEPKIQKTAVAALKKMRSLLPGAVQLVYDNYNALAIGFGPSDRASEAIFSIAVYPRWVSLFFLRGAELHDPEKILQGSGNVVRYVVIADRKEFDKKAIRVLMKEALKRAGHSLQDRRNARMIIKSVSAKQRPRRPSSGKRSAS